MLNQPKILLFVLWVFFLGEVSYAQKVGIVLSGGGAAGISHIGFLKALEEHNIPIDYITGSSMGALIGSMYAAGYSPQEMEVFFTSDRFTNMARGKLEDRHIYYFKEKEPDASWVTIRLSKSALLSSALPTNLISPVILDFYLLSSLSGAAAAADYNFDQLMIPFRCVAADVSTKQQKVFKEGHLSEAVRASISYPFYLKPIKIDGKLLFDGGLYNNFPSDVMNRDFKPDVIIGNNAGDNVPPPNEDDLISQVKNLLMQPSAYTTDGTPGLVINSPIQKIGTFAFSKSKEAIEAGYAAAIENIDSIKKHITKRTNPQLLNERRLEFRKSQPKLDIDKINIEGVKKSQANYVRGSLRRRKKQYTLEDLRPGYVRVFADDKIKSIYPTAKFNPYNSKYDLNLKIKREKAFIFDFGGNFSSRAINTGFISAKYNYLGNFGLSIMANSYFGKLYGSAQVKARIDFPYFLPFYIEPYFLLNRWDYFNSKTVLFERVNTSFLIQYETFGGIEVGFPAWSKGRVKAGVNMGVLTDEYYQNLDNPAKADTADRTTFDFTSGYLHYDRNSLNRKQYASEGSRLTIKARYIDGIEQNVPGSTAALDGTYRIRHQYFQLKISYENYYVRRGRFRLGMLAEGVYSSQKFFNNYQASILRAPAFFPIPESKTYFLDPYRAHQYIAVGQKVIVKVFNPLDIRLEAYLFQPVQEIFQNDQQQAELGSYFGKRYVIASGSIVYHSPVGPMAINANYYHNVNQIAGEEELPLSFMFHFGYILFNRKALD